MYDIMDEDKVEEEVTESAEEIEEEGSNPCAEHSHCHGHSTGKTVLTVLASVAAVAGGIWLWREKF